MGVLDKWIIKLRTLETQLQAGLDMAVREELPRMADMQRERLAKGQDATGANIKRTSTGSTTYSPQYARKKGRRAPIDLNLTGAFYGGIKATRIAPARVQLWSSDFKNKFLPFQYENIYGFAPDQERELREMFVRHLKFTIYQHFIR